MVVIPNIFGNKFFQFKCTLISFISNLNESAKKFNHKNFDFFLIMRRSNSIHTHVQALVSNPALRHTVTTTY